MSNKLDIALAMIVRNEGENLENALISASRICRQLIVVDTGSDDSTASIASRLGAEVYFYKWNDNFAEARNFSIRHARTKWILILDADEILDFNDNDIQTLRNLMNINNAGGINIKIKSILYNQDSNISSQHSYTRIFLNDPKINFEGRIHEQIRPSIEARGFNVLSSELKILHYGYAEKDISKIQRNIKLLKLEIEEKPDDAWLYYHLGEAHFSNTENQDAKECFKRALNNFGLSEEQIEKTRIRLAQIALSEENIEEIVKQLDFKSNDIHTEGLRKYVLAASIMLNHDFVKAYEVYNSKEVKSSSLVDQNQVQLALDSIKKYIFNID